MSEPTDRTPADYDALPAAEQAAVRAAWAQDMTRRRESLDFAAEFAAAGVAYSELDEHGNVVHRTVREVNPVSVFVDWSLVGHASRFCTRVRAVDRRQFARRRCRRRAR